MAEITFQNFWDAYALKRDRIAAERAWKKLSSKDRQAAIDGIAPYRDDCQRRGISRMYAQGYLNHRRWEDDFTSGDTQLSTLNNSSHHAPLPHSTAQLADARRREVQELSRLATAGAAALAGLVGGSEDE